MDMNKLSFILFKDFAETLHKLSDEQAGKVIKAIFEYQCCGEAGDVDHLTEVIITPVISQFKRDAVKYENVCKRNQGNGLKGGRPKNPSEPKKATGLSGLSKEPKKADTDNDTDNEKLLLSEFEYCWKSYGRKGTKASALNYWKKHKQEDRDAIKAKIPAYVSSTPELKYRKDFSGWINPTNRIWENKIVGDSPQAMEQQSATPVYTTMENFLNGK